MAYSTVASVKAVLQIAADIETFDDELESCIASRFLFSKDLAVFSW
jgi:hypothetical protein